MVENQRVMECNGLNYSQSHVEIQLSYLIMQIYKECGVTILIFIQAPVFV